MRSHYACLGTLAIASLLACSSAPKTKGTDSPGTSNGGSGAKVSGKGGASQGGRSGSNSGGAASGSSVVPISEKMTLSSVRAYLGGRVSDDLYVEVEGTAEQGLFASVEVVLRDDKGNEVSYFDSDWNGELDSGRGRVVPDALPTDKALKLTVKLPNMARHASIKQVDVALFDREGRRTEPRTTDIVKPAVKEQAQDCDPAFLQSRCRQGLSCVGDPGVCQEGTAPTIVRGAYQRNSDGVNAFIRLRGLDPDEDVLAVRVDFLSAKGEPVYLDLDGDETVDASSKEVIVGIRNSNGGYRFIDETGDTFPSNSPKVGLTVIDSRQHESPTVKYDLESRLTRNLGETCDVDGFDQCVKDAICLPGAQGGGQCATLSQVQSGRCAKAEVWDLGTAPLKITGVIQGVSAWEGPSGCFPATAMGRPEAVIKIKVPGATKSLTLSTNEPETQIDTGIAVLPSCSAGSDTMLGCNDDSQGYTSSLTLTDVAAGYYFVIIESVQAEGGSFGLKATIK